ncbi:MAG: hypothetical protein KBB14_04700 [Thermoanaerobaculia bacterium]|nr:hypothetical protein [Thermoanaerobaculia bacterium]
MSRRSRSKQPSPSRKRPSLPPFFLDENLSGKELREALVSWGYQVERIQDHFAPGTPDTVWLTKVGREGWLLLTKDRAIARKPAELSAYLTARVYGFFVAYGDLKKAEIVVAMEKAIPKIARLLKKQRPPALRRVSPAGDLARFEGVP